MKKWQRPTKPFTLLFSLLLFISFSKGIALGETYKVAFIDTGFCTQKLPIIKNVKYLEQNISSSICSQINPRAWHGQAVLEKFLENIKLNDGENLQVFLYSVFNKNGEQDILLWQNALKGIERDKVRHTFIALGVPFIQSKKLALPSGYFYVSAGQVGLGIDKEMKLWPHELSNDQLFLVDGWQKNIQGAYYQDPLHLYQSKIKFVTIIPAQNINDKIAHTSLALALFAKKSWELCRFEAKCLLAKGEKYKNVLIY